MAFGKCGSLLNREVKNNPAKGSTGQNGAVTRREALLWNMLGAGHLREVGLGGSAPLALLQSLSFSERWSLSCPSEAAAGLGPAAAGKRKWTGDSVTVGFLSDSGLDPFFRVVQRPWATLARIFGVRTEALTPVVAGFPPTLWDGKAIRLNSAPPSSLGKPF